MKTFEQGRGSNDGNLPVLRQPDPRIEEWIEGPLGVDFRVLKFAEIVPEKTELSEIKKALEKVTGGRDFRLGRADTYTETRWKANVETAAAALTIQNSSRQRVEELDKLREEFESLKERYPDEAWSIDQQIMDLYDTEAISRENARKDYDSLLTMLYADYHAKLQAAAEEASRNLRVYEEHSREMTLKTTDKRMAELVDNYFKDEEKV